MNYNQKLLQAKIDTLYNVLHELNLFPDKFIRAKKDVRTEIDRLNAILYNNKKTCPNCLAEHDKNTICLNCGYGYYSN